MGTKLDKLTNQILLKSISKLTNFKDGFVQQSVSMNGLVKDTLKRFTKEDVSNPEFVRDAL
ncbi:MAG: hypothetical protein CVU44_00145 [Chloroflexi bacterium HGW-Chloroflexi-6]|nr:MAG: hypothetical protein CVU44_00145 [Chloroflexi bacterium HGW-Chloroflexi-6]